MKDEQETHKINMINLKDYQPHPYRITHSELLFDLDPVATKVTTTHSVIRLADNPTPLCLDCENMEILWVAINQQKLEPSQYRVEDNCLAIDNVPEEFLLGICNNIDPSSNTQLSGLYRSGDMLCTQCEAEGFRRIAPAIDRPDNLATYQVTLKGPAELFPVLLCNGNLIGQEKQGIIHSTTWHDPYPKPTYLFALVAGNLSLMRDSFTTMSGQSVKLHFYARDRDIEKCEYAMDALKRSMQWDEQVYGREYDLDLFNVVAVSDFNMGAMENKSLNIFNTKYVLADLDTATDTDFQNIERVIGHEYFHNWSGNRVTCRDWFQLSLKEGFTVFRDQEFSADMGSAGVQRISDVNVLRNHQFPEDAGPMAHAVRPESYNEINNFYTVTIYEKGAEVVRMLRTLVGNEAFRKGTDLYFGRHDGQAVTTDDFVAAISDASGVNMDQFKNWYSQAGTPEVQVSMEYDKFNSRYSIWFTQSCPATPDQVKKNPFVIPIRLALLDQHGTKLDIGNNVFEQLVVVDQSKQELVFNNIHSEPVPSLLRGFSSPVKLDIDLSTHQLGILFRHDDDAYNQWQAGQRLFELCILDNASRIVEGIPCRYDDQLITYFGDVLRGENSDQAFTAKLLGLPGESWLGELSLPVNPTVIAAARLELQQKIASHYYDLILQKYHTLQNANQGQLQPSQMAARTLRDLCLSYLCSLDTRNTFELAAQQIKDGITMTDKISALTAIINSSSHHRDKLIAAFYDKWKDEPLVVDKWFRLQATARREQVLDDVKQLANHQAFDFNNPNKVYSLILAYVLGNPAGFHLNNGEGYHFLAEWVLKMDPVNSQVAARLASALSGWRKMISPLNHQMQSTLEQILASGPLSTDVSEIISRALAKTEN